MEASGAGAGMDSSHLCGPPGPCKQEEKESSLATCLLLSWPAGLALGGWNRPCETDHRIKLCPVRREWGKQGVVVSWETSQHQEERLLGDVAVTGCGPCCTPGEWGEATGTSNQKGSENSNARSAAQGARSEAFISFLFLKCMPEKLLEFSIKTRSVILTSITKIFLMATHFNFPLGKKTLHLSHWDFKFLMPCFWKLQIQGL